MASNSHQKSSSSARSRTRRLTHVGTGTQSREYSAQPKVEGAPDKKPSRSTRASGRGSRPDTTARRGAGARDPLRKQSAKQAERARLQAERKRALLLRVGLIVGALALIWGAWAALTNSGLFAIERVTVEGANELSVDEVVAVAAIEPGATLLGIDEDGVVERLESLAWIESADLVRRYPSTALLQIEERERFVMLDLGNTFWALDRTGRVLGESVPATATPVPLIRDVPVFVPVAGEIVTPDEVKNAISVLAGISPELRSSVKTLSSPSAEETSLITDASVEIMIGRAEQLSEKSALALEIMAEQGSAVVFIDVRSLERPVSRGLND
ncbi:MAG: cell division protein FtsQ/DivIB [Coriobacteriia bacterium]